MTKSCFRWPKSLRKASGCHNFLSSNSADLQTRTGWPLIHWSWNILMLFSCLGSSSNNNLPPQSHWWGAVCFLWSRWHETCCGGWILASENYKNIFTSVGKKLNFTSFFPSIYKSKRRQKSREIHEEFNFTNFFLPHTLWQFFI